MSALSKEFKSLVRKSVETAPTSKPFYSPIDQAIANITQGKGTGQQMLAELLKTKGVAKELKDRPAIKKALEQPKITKQELERVAAEHPPAQIEESRSSGTFNQLEPTLPNDKSLELVEDPPTFSGNKYPYGVRDTKTGDIIGYGWDKGDAILDVYSGYPQYWGKHAKHESWVIPGGENYREILLKLPKGEGGVFKTTHFEGEPNILAHARVTDRVGPNGEKILHVEEIQSDWHQAGRDARNKEIKRLMQSEGIDKATASKRVPESFGYKANAEQKYVEYLEDLQKRVAENIKQTMIGEGVPEERAIILGQKMAERMADDPRKLAGFLDEDDQRMVLHQARLKDREAVPDAPFKQNWHELVMKRLLDDAARNGYDKVVLTPGAEQAKRYKLSNVIDEINVVGRTHALTGEKTKQVALDTVDGRSLRLGVANDGTIDNVSDSSIEGFLGKKLDEVVGKDVAKNIMESGSQTISGEGLQVGGEGMKGFYDQILPSYLNNYGKPYGSRVGEYTMPEVATPLHSFDITPQMREDIIGKGLPLYQVAPVGIGAGAAMQGEQPEGYGAGGVIKKAVKAVLPKDEAFRLTKERSLVEPTHYSSAHRIAPPHEVRDTEKLNLLIKSMKENGWQGRPILTYDAGRGDEALTGSHRLKAAEEANIEVPIYRIENAGNYIDKNGNSIFDVGFMGQNDQVKWLNQFGDKNAAQLLKQEPEGYADGGVVSRDEGEQLFRKRAQDLPNLMDSHERHKLQELLQRTRIQGSGGKDQYGTGAGGRVTHTVPLGNGMFVSPYIEGNVYKPVGQPAMGGVTGAGLNIGKTWKNGGSVSGDAMHMAVMDKQLRKKHGN